MYKVTFPIAARVKKTFEELLPIVKKAKVDRVVIVDNRNIEDKKAYELSVKATNDLVRKFKAAGYETGVWIGQTIGHGGVLSNNTTKHGGPDFMNITDVDANVVLNNYCPTDERFLDWICQWIKDVAIENPDFMMLDDDYRMCMRSGFMTCLCDNHLREFNRRAGREFTREEVKNIALAAEPNKYRKIWLDIQGDALRHGAERFRAALNEVNPDIRLGLCAVHSTWGIDGVDAVELSKILAGNTKPFIRKIGAPYWAYNDPFALAPIIEYERLENEWCKDENIEIFAEGDTYPRPREACTSSILEGFDTALRADGNSDGILKYMMDYSEGYEFEPGYIDRHIRNLPLYEKIDKFFGNKKAVGVKPFVPMNMAMDYTFGGGKDGMAKNFAWNYFPTPAQKFITGCSIPTTYEDTDTVSVVFDEHAKYVTEKMLNNGLILNMRAALILKDMGVDVGIVDVKKIATPTGCYSRIENRFHALNALQPMYDIRKKDGARVLFDYSVGSDKIEGDFEYENEKGQKFFIIPFDNYTHAIARSYFRHTQMVKTVEWLSGKKLAATCPKNPGLYIMNKENENELTVGLWNFCTDDIMTPVVDIADKFSKIKCLNCEAEIDGNTVNFKTDIPPMGFAAFTLIKLI